MKVTRMLAAWWVATLVLGYVLSGMPAGADTAVPYTDPNATGSIGFCDINGNVVTHGSITDQPFVWLAVSSSPAPALFNQFGKDAILYAYQPRQGTSSGEWTGAQLTGASYYTNGAHPMVAATTDSATLQKFLVGRPLWDGLVQIRMFLGLPGEGIHSTSYPATDIQVNGNSWTVVRGASVPCDVGIAVSKLAGGLPPTSLATASPRAAGAQSGQTPAPSSTAGSVPTSGARNSPTPSTTSTSPATSGSGGTAGAGGTGGGAATNAGGAGTTNGGGNTATVIAVGLALVALLGAALFVVRLRRRQGRENPSP